MPKPSLCLAVVFLAITATVAKADVSYDPGQLSAELGQYPRRLPRITIFGRISPDDLEQFKLFSELANRRHWTNVSRVSPDQRDITADSFHYTVRVDSPGGDLYASMMIGRLVRRDKALVVVLPASSRIAGEDVAKGECLSSCVFILVGGARRLAGLPYGKVGIHRPVDPDDTLTSADLQKLHYAQVEKDVKAYLREMNVPTELWDHMLRIPPEEVKLLNNDELDKYGLRRPDPYVDAAFTAAEAKSRGITIEELLRRRAAASNECDSSFVLGGGTAGNRDYGDCYYRIMNGR